MQSTLVLKPAGAAFLFFFLYKRNRKIFAERELFCPLVRLNNVSWYKGIHE